RGQRRTQHVSHPRVPPLPINEWPAEMRDAIAALRPPVMRHPVLTTDGDRPQALNALGTFAHYPELTRAYHTFGGHLLYHPTLHLPTRELLILRVAAVRGCDYEWMQHVVIGGDVGLSDDEIEAARSADTPLLRAVDELIGEGAITDPTWSALSE